MPSLCSFMRSLCKASRDQLKENNNPKKKSFWPGKTWKSKNSLPLSLLLHRVGDVTLRIFKSSRPLLHLLKVWAIAGPELFQTAKNCQKEREISKRSIQYIHDIIISMLAVNELPHFHFNEAILKPFENLLNIETLDFDVQDQIFTCLFEIVEAHKTEIKSGWRPLFGMLKNRNQKQKQNVIDIFRIFLDSENTLVFANAGLDCILCLLAYLEVQTTEDDIMPAEILKFVERCFSVLCFIYQMPNGPNLHSTYKIKGINYTHLIEATVPSSIENFQYFGNDYLQMINDEFSISYRSLHIDRENLRKLEELDRPSGVLKVLFLLFDGLTNAMIVAPVIHQSAIIQTIFKLLKSMLDREDMRNFGFYVLNHLVIPMCQDLLRYNNKKFLNWSPVEKNFKLTISMTTDMVVQFIEKSAESERKAGYKQQQKFTKIKRPIDNLKFGQFKSCDEDPVTADPSRMDSRLALKQLALVLVEISAQPQEKIARNGVSCLKHLTFSLGELLNAEEWEIICSAIHRASYINLAPIRQLSFAFYENSDSFYGNGATVKIVARRDCTLEEINRIYSLSTQVFMMDSQREAVNPKGPEIKIINEDRNYFFLLYNNDAVNDNSYVLRIPYKSLVVGLLASQFLLQLIANIILASLRSVPTELHSVIYDYYAMSSSTTGIINSNNANKKPHFKLSYRCKEILYRCLRIYLQSAIDFDYRPGLKFLIQKVSSIDCAANLYKQMSSAFILSFLNGIDQYMSDIDNLNLKLEDLKYIIESCTNVDKEVKKKEFFIRNFFAIRDIWNLISELYMKLVHTRVPMAIEPPPNNEINIVENKLEQLETELSEINESDPENPLQKSASEESVSIVLKNETNSNQKTNPFNTVATSNQQQQQQVPAEIEQQRNQSLSEDEKYKMETLKQMLIATLEFMRLIPESQGEETIKLLFTGKISEALAEVEKGN
jgi:brefeldin A-inhibited guanine nucleotide-exchange protein 3